jgi:polysaccharide biosynthesis protein PslH
MKERALLVVPVLPAAGGNGLAMRAGLLLEGLSPGFAVDVVVIPAFGRPGPPSAFVSDLAREVHVLEPGGTEQVADMVRRLGTPAGRARAQALHPLPRLAAAATPAAAENVAQLADGAAVIVAMRTYLAPALDVLLDASTGPPIVLDIDDIESDTQRLLGRSEEADRLERLEAHYLPLADKVTCCSIDDAALVAGRHRLSGVIVVPNAVRVPAHPRASEPRHDLLLVGNLSYAPNVEAARWVVDQVLPLLGDDVRIAIVGSRPAADVLALADDDRVVLAADVPGVSPWYARSRVAVVPVLRGGGTHVKLLEAFAHGLPAVATSVGARGLPWPDAPAPAIVGDTAEEFATACQALLNDPHRRAELGRRGRELVSRHASVDVVAPAIASLANAVLRG